MNRWETMNEAVMVPECEFEDRNNSRGLIEVTAQCSIPLGGSKKEVIYLSRLKDLDLEISEEVTEVTDIEVKEAKEVYGDKARNPDRDIIVLYIDSLGENARVSINTPKDMKVKEEDGEMIYEVVEEGSVKWSLANPNSKFGVYYDRHGHGPQVGDDIKVELSDNGFWRFRA